MQSAVAATLCVLGAALGVSIAMRWRAGQSDEVQPALERRAELVAAVMQVALFVGIVGLAQSVFVTDHLVGGIRGAMCAFGVVAPYALATPGHLCPFCLLHAQGGWLGWPLFGAPFAAAVTGLGVGVVELHRPTDQPAGPVRRFQQTLARWSALAWFGVLAFSACPVVRYLVHSGGVPVFGETT